MRKFLVRLLADRTGVTAIEYGLILALIALTIMSALIALGNRTTEIWDNVAEQVVNA